MEADDCYQESISNFDFCLYSACGGRYKCFQFICDYISRCGRSSRTEFTQSLSKRGRAALFQMRNEKTESDDQRNRVVSPTSTIESGDRRVFVRSAMVATAAIAVGSTILSHSRAILPESTANSDAPLTGCSSCVGVTGISTGCQPLCHSCAIGVKGSSSRWGVVGCARSSSYGIGVYGSSNAGSGAGVYAVASGSNVVPIVAQGLGGGSSDLQVWQKGCCTPRECRGVSAPTILSVVNQCGWFGIGTRSPSSALCVNGKAHIVSSPICSAVLIVNNDAKGSIVANGIKGTSNAGTGVCGASCSGFAVAGISKSSVGVYGGSSSGTSVYGAALCGKAVPVIAQGAPDQSANLQQWGKGCSTLSIVNKCGWLGVGANSAPTTLTVGGSLSAKTAVATANYTMGASDFAVLASGAIKVTLPPASTATGMIVFIKNTSTSTVTIDRSGTDTIEGATSKKLKKQYDSLQLISNGTNEWFVLGNSICAAFTS